MAPRHRAECKLVAYTADIHFRGATGLRGFKDVDGI